MALITVSGVSYLQLVTASPWVQDGGSFAVMGWARKTSNNGWECICSSYDGSANSWEFGVSNGANFGVYLTWSTGGTYYAGDSGTSGPVNVINVWYHCAAAYNAATKTIQLYQDGILVRTTSAMAAAIGAGSRKLRIGHSSDNAAFGMPGHLAHVRMFRGVLNGEDIRACRTSRTIPGYLRPRIVADAPLERPPAGSTAYELDRGPLALGPFTATGTPTWGVNPPGLSDFNAESLVNYSWTDAAGAAAPRFRRTIALRTGSRGAA